MAKRIRIWLRLHLIYNPRWQESHIVQWSRFNAIRLTDNLQSVALLDLDAPELDTCSRMTI